MWYITDRYQCVISQTTPVSYITDRHQYVISQITLVWYITDRHQCVISQTRPVWYITDRDQCVISQTPNPVLSYVARSRVDMAQKGIALPWFIYQHCFTISHNRLSCTCISIYLICYWLHCKQFISRYISGVTADEFAVTKGSLHTLFLSDYLCSCFWQRVLW